VCVYLCVYKSVLTPVFLAVGTRLIGDKVEYQLISVNQLWSSVLAGVYTVALLFRHRYRHLATSVGVWLLKPVLLMFALQFYTVGLGINRYVFAIDSLRTVVLTTALLPVLRYLSAYCHNVAVSRRSSATDDRRLGAPAGADLAASNCLLALAVLRLALDQPEADLASAVQIWLLILHPIVLVWFWVDANVRRYYANKHRLGSQATRRPFRLSKMLHARFRARTVLAADDNRQQMTERITVV